MEIIQNIPLVKANIEIQKIIGELCGLQQRLHNMLDPLERMGMKKEMKQIQEIDLQFQNHLSNAYIIRNNINKSDPQDRNIKFCV